MMELQAQLYKTQELARLRKEGGMDASDTHRGGGFNVAELMKGRNAGVEERDMKDRLSIKVG